MIVLDTNVLSELMRFDPASQVKQWVLDQPESELFTSAITEAEVFYGVERLPSGKKRDRLLEAAIIMFDDEFQGRVLAFDSRAARSFGTIAVGRRARGKPISEADAQIAAIALSRGAALATRDVKDFEDCGIAVIDPWSSR